MLRGKLAPWNSSFKPSSHRTPAARLMPSEPGRVDTLYSRQWDDSYTTIVQFIKKENKNIIGYGGSSFLTIVARNVRSKTRIFFTK